MAHQQAQGPRKHVGTLQLLALEGDCMDDVCIGEVPSDSESSETATPVIGEVSVVLVVLGAEQVVDAI